MLVFGGFHFSKDLHVSRRLLEVSPTDSLHVVQLGVVSTGLILDFSGQLSQLLIKSLVLVVDLFTLGVELVLVITDLHEVSRTTVERLLKVLKLTSLLEKGLTSVTALIFKDLLALEVCTISTLLELVPVVAIANLQVVKRVAERLDLLLRLADLPVKFVTEPLKFLTFLRSLDHKVSLGVLTISFDVATGRLVSLDKTFKLDPQILDFLLS